MVIGTRRLPTFDDLGAIPYIDALIMEVQRRYPIVPLSTYNCSDSTGCSSLAESFVLDLPHKLRNDDVYNGYLLDKDSLVVVNNMSVLSFRLPPLQT